MLWYKHPKAFSLATGPGWRKYWAAFCLSHCFPTFLVPRPKRENIT